MKHFSHYVLPGAQCLLVSGEFAELMAFKNQDGSVVLVLNNKDNQAKTVNVKLVNEVISLELQANSINTVTVK